MCASRLVPHTCPTSKPLTHAHKDAIPTPTLKQATLVATGGERKEGIGSAAGHHQWGGAPAAASIPEVGVIVSACRRARHALSGWRAEPMTRCRQGKARPRAVSFISPTPADSTPIDENAAHLQSQQIYMRGFSRCRPYPLIAHIIHVATMVAIYGHDVP